MKRSRIVWKLSAVLVSIILLVFVTWGCLNNLADRRHVLESAREVSRFNSETILVSLRKLMMTRDITGITELIDSLAGTGSLYRDLSLISHDGVVVASTSGAAGENLGPMSRPCRTCHALARPEDGLGRDSFDEVVGLRDGGRVITVVTPIRNEQSCWTADCHAHSRSRRVLGVLKTDFSLRRADALTRSRTRETILAVIAAIVLCTAAVWLTMGRLLERPIRVLVAGMKRIAGHDFDLRIDMDRNDEMGLLARSFNDMTSKLAGSRRELEETKDYLEGIVENSADIIITVDPSGLIRTLNRGAENILGYAREEVIGKRIEMLFADPRERNVAIAKLKNTDNVVNYETHFLTKTGEVKDVILTLSRLRDRSGQPIGTFGISKDITAEKKLQHQLIQAERFAAIGQAFTGLQHAMKNMLNSLKGGSYMVGVGLDTDNRETLKEGWNMVREGISRMTDLSSDMLRYVKDHKPEFEATDLREVILRLCDGMKQSALNRGVTMHLDISEALPEVMCDAGQIHSALMDILSNAVDACVWKEYQGGEIPEIVVRAGPDEDGSHAVIEIRDNGCGMTDEVQRRIFTPFFSTKKSLGTGLGLALTWRIISLHGGRITLLSEPDRGSSFTVVLPVNPAGQAPENAIPV
jgi:PAS domain S-box-containing protein